MSTDDSPTMYVERLGQLYVAIISDILDERGHRSQVMDGSVRPVCGAYPVAGTAFPIQEVLNPVPTPEGEAGMRSAAVDAIPSGAVAVVATGGSRTAACWGELLSTRAQARGAAGVVTDGAVRDVDFIRRLGFPVFAAGITPRDAGSRTAVAHYGQPVICGGVAVRLGDFLLADFDGVVVVPREVVADVVAEAEARKAQEDLARAMLAKGESASAVLAEHGVL
jgi:4-hydroxy-4-methyl-2-oxoglutarate aldolase